jgi:hypothetical protein
MWMSIVTGTLKKTRVYSGVWFNTKYAMQHWSVFTEGSIKSSFVILLCAKAFMYHKL